MSLVNKIILVLTGFLISGSLMANPTVEIKTNLGNITVQLEEQKAPISTKNFLMYVNKGFYNKTIFHRVIPGFMIQGGGFTQTMSQKPTDDPIKNEAGNGLKNERGTIAMARTNDPNSATSQFFINLTDNAALDYKPSNPGYTVFGHVTSGMEVVDKIATQRTHSEKGHQDVPVEPVIIESVSVINK